MVLLSNIYILVLFHKATIRKEDDISTRARKGSDGGYLHVSFHVLTCFPSLPTHLRAFCFHSEVVLLFETLLSCSTHSGGYWIKEELKVCPRQGGYTGLWTNAKRKQQLDYTKRFQTFSHFPAVCLSLGLS